MSNTDNNLSNNTVDMTPSSSNNNSSNNNKNTNTRNTNTRNRNTNTRTRNTNTRTRNTNTRTRNTNTRTTNTRNTNTSTNQKNGNGKNQTSSANQLSLPMLGKVVLYFLCVLIVLNIGLLVYFNAIHRKNYLAVDAVVISGDCLDSENVIGMMKTKCKFKIKYDMPDANNKKYSVENEIKVNNKNKIREDDKNKIIKIDVNIQDHKVVKVQRDKARDNFYLVISLFILILLAAATFKINRRR